MRYKRLVKTLLNRILNYSKFEVEKLQGFLLTSFLITMGRIKFYRNRREHFRYVHLIKLIGYFLMDLNCCSTRDAATFNMFIQLPRDNHYRIDRVDFSRMKIV